MTVTEQTEPMLCVVTIRRTYTDDYLEQWERSRPFEDSQHREWGSSVLAIQRRWAEIHAKPDPYWDARYKDQVIHVERVPDEKVEAMRASAAQTAAYWHTPLCCGKAVLDNCVCRFKTVCPDHGSRCHGSHD